MSDRVASQLAGSPQTQQPIRELLIRKLRFPDGGYGELLTRIDDRGQLVLDGADAGERIRQWCGDWDYEYTETVPAAWKDTVLLHLMAERFDKTSDFRKWCEARGVPTQFWSWA